MGRRKKQEAPPPVEAYGDRLIARNKRASFDYELGERFEAGLVLTGSEVKMLRMGKADLTDAWCAIEKREGAWVHVPSGARFDAKRGAWSEAKGAPAPLVSGFDTFWVTWSLAHPDTVVLTPKGPIASPKKARPPSSRPTRPPTSRPAKGGRWF